MLPEQIEWVAIDRDQAIKPNLSPVFELQKICLVRSIHIHNLILNSDDFSSYMIGNLTSLPQRC